MASEKKDSEEECSYTHTEQQKAARNNLMGLMGKVDETKVTMAENIENVLVRREKLVELGEHSEKISADAARLANTIGLAPKEK